MKVAWIGLGHMGLPTAKTVAGAGHNVTGFDVRSLPAEDTKNLTIASSPHEAAEGCEVICISVFDDAQVEEVLAGPEGIFPILAPGTVVAMFTTGTIGSAQKLAAAAPAGIAVLDTCFSRQQGMIPSGQLNILAGGDEDALNRCRPVLQAFAKNIYHLGGSGMGRAIKLVNNALLAGNSLIARDALQVARALGLDPQEAARIMLECSGASDALNIFVKPDPAANLQLMSRTGAKDCTAMAEEAEKAGVGMGVLGAAIASYVAPRQ